MAISGMGSRQVEAAATACKTLGCAAALILLPSAMQHPGDELLSFAFTNCWELLTCTNKQYRLNAYPDQSALSDSEPLVLDPLLAMLIRLSGTRRWTISAERYQER